VTVLPLFHSSLPVAASSAYNTALDALWAAGASVSSPSLERNSPPESAKTTPLTIVGGSGETMSRETQPGRSRGVPFSSNTLNATIEPFLTSPFPAANPAPVATEPAAGANTQRVPAESCQLANEPAAKFAIENVGVVDSG
jgi:hypothetical protein